MDLSMATYTNDMGMMGCMSLTSYADSKLDGLATINGLPKLMEEDMKYQGMTRDWLACCFAGSLCLFFGALWLYNNLILLAFVIQLVALPGWTAAEIYNSYNRPLGNVFFTWWYAAVCVF